MNLNLKTKKDYETEIKKLGRMSKAELEKLLGELYQKRYIDQDINYESYYRITSHVYVQKTRTGSSLIFHLKKFLGIVVGVIISSYI